MDNQSYLKSNKDCLNSNGYKCDITENFIENKLKLRKKVFNEEINKFNKELKAQISKSKFNFDENSISKIYTNNDILGKEFIIKLNLTCNQLKELKELNFNDLKDSNSLIEILKNLTNLRHITDFIQNDLISLNSLFTYIIEYGKNALDFLFQNLQCCVIYQNIMDDNNKENMDLCNLYCLVNQINVSIFEIS